MSEAQSLSYLASFLWPQRKWLWYVHSFRHDRTFCSNTQTFPFQLRNKKMVHTPMTFAAPLVGLFAAVIAMAFFYAANTSETRDTLQSWTCRWQMAVMTMSPHFGSLCREARAGLYLSILLIPLEALVVGVAGWQFAVERQTPPTYGFTAQKAGSPAPN